MLPPKRSIDRFSLLYRSFEAFAIVFTVSVIRNTQMIYKKKHIQGSVRGTLAGIKKPPTFRSGALCSRYLFSQVGQRIVMPSASVRGTLAGIMYKAYLRYSKRPHRMMWSFVFALLIFPGSRPPSIVSADELNFCVRNGNRWTLIAINTNSMDDALSSFISKAFSF